jgi:amino acid transporter
VKLVTGAASATATLDVPERLGYKLKRVCLGRPLITAQLHQERLSKKTALGVLSSDCISSSAYGTEEMLIFLLPAFGLAGFSVLMPMTLVVLAVLVIMTLLYRQVVSIYTRAGGSYVVARENFGPKVAQVASVALLIDYIVTVAVQSAAGTAAIGSLVPAASGRWASEAITVGVVLLLFYGNLRGVREAGRAFALPTYLFVGTAGLAIVIGIVRELSGDLPRLPHQAGMIGVHDKGHAIFTGAAIYVLLKAFANGGASLTGLEAISNGVSAFKKPVGRNARQTLTVMSALLGFLVLGVSYLAFETHATPYQDGTPTVISQVAKVAFGSGPLGHLGFVLIQVATALILYTGANTPFTGFPFLASFIAEDSFMPRQMTRRGHRLAFSNGIVTLTAAAVGLLLAVGTVVDKLIPFYAIGVFTGFSMAGFGMAQYYRTHREPGWRRRGVTSLVGGTVSAVVVLVFAVVKFSQGAWLVVVLFPILWMVLMRLNKHYRDEARALDVVAQLAVEAEAPHYARHSVVVLVDRLDLAVVRALRYAGSLRPTAITAVHFVLDSEAAARLERDWIDRRLGDRVPLTLLDCPDRRLIRGIGRYALNAVIADRAEVTLLLPRRTFGRLSQRLLHDRTADRIAAAVGRIPHVAATIVPFDTTLPPPQLAELEQRRDAAASAPALPAGPDDQEPAPAAPVSVNGHRPVNGAVPTGAVPTGAVPTGAVAMGAVAMGAVPMGAVPTGTVNGSATGTVPIGTVTWKQKVTVEGRIKSVQVGTTAGRSLEVQLFDRTGGMRLLFFGRTRIPGLEPGVQVRASGRVGEYKGHLALANPIYELVNGCDH